ncbi:hypothetical protein ACOME3_000157 [Neoechinorhynchus agilis]
MIRYGLGASDILFTNPLFSRFFSLGRVMAVKRGEGLQQKSMMRALELLGRCEWLHMFPEGKVVNDKKIGRLKWGVASLVIDAQLRYGHSPMVLPIMHWGFENILPVHHYFPRINKQIGIIVGEELDFSHLIDQIARRHTSMDPIILKQVTMIKITEIIRANMIKLYNQLNIRMISISRTRDNNNLIGRNFLPRMRMDDFGEMEGDDESSTDDDGFFQLSQSLTPPGRVIPDPATDEFMHPTERAFLQDLRRVIGGLYQALNQIRSTGAIHQREAGDFDQLARNISGMNFMVERNIFDPVSVVLIRRHLFGAMIDLNELSARYPWIGRIHTHALRVDIVHVLNLIDNRLQGTDGVQFRRNFLFHHTNNRNGRARPHNDFAHMGPPDNNNPMNSDDDDDSDYWSY